MTSAGEVISLGEIKESEESADQRDWSEEKMPDRCVAVNCSNVMDPSKCIFVHTIPFFGD